MWETRAKQCLSSKPHWPLSDMERLVRDGEAVSPGLPMLKSLKDATGKVTIFIETNE